MVSYPARHPVFTRIHPAQTHPVLVHWERSLTHRCQPMKPEIFATVNRASLDNYAHIAHGMYRVVLVFVRKTYLFCSGKESPRLRGNFPKCTAIHVRLGAHCCSLGPVTFSSTLYINIYMPSNPGMLYTQHVKMTIRVLCCVF